MVEVEVERREMARRPRGGGIGERSSATTTSKVRAAAEQDDRCEQDHDPEQGNIPAANFVDIAEGAEAATVAAPLAGEREDLAAAIIQAGFLSKMSSRVVDRV